MPYTLIIERVLCILSHFIQALLFGCLIGMGSPTLLAQQTTLPIQYNSKDLSKSLVICIERYLKEIPPHLSFEDTITQTQKGITDILQAQGYFKAQIRPVIKRTKKNYRLNYSISKGPRLKITTLTIQLIGEGATNPLLQQKRHKLSLKQGEFMNNDNYESIKEELYALVLKEGYLKAFFKEHTVAINLDEYTATITLIMDTGPRYTVGPIQFSKQSLCDSFLKKYINFQTGDPYRLRTVLESQHFLESSGYFQKVLIQTKKCLGNQCPIHIKLVPSPKYYALANFSLKSDAAPHIKLEGLIRRLNQKGHQFISVANFDYDHFDGFNLYTIPGTYPAQQKHQLKLSWVSGYRLLKNNQARLFKESSTALLSYLYKHIYPKWHVSSDVSLHYERFKASDYSEVKHHRGLVFGMLLHNTSDNWSFKHQHNYHLHCKAQLAIAPYDNFRLLQIESELSYFLRLSQSMHSSYCLLKGRTGHAIGALAKDVPTSLRFKAGDFECPRGHTSYLLGSSFVSGGIEMRIPIKGLCYLSPFFEIAFDVNANNANDYLRIIRGSTGISLLLWHPRVGTVEISSIFRLNPVSTQSAYGWIAKISNHP